MVISNQVKYYAPDKIGELALLKRVKAIDASEPFPKKKKDESFIDARDIFGNVYLRFLREHIILREFSPILDEFLHHWEEPQGAREILPQNAKLVRGTILGSNWVVDSNKYADYIHWKNTDDQLDFYKMNKPE